MIKAVFFDLYYTLVTYDPPQEELEARALKEFGIDADPEIFRRPLLAANEFIYNEIARQPLSARSQEEKLALYSQYQEIVLREAGIKYDKNLVLGVLGKAQQFKMNLVLFDDVAPALNELRSRGLVLGLISNIEQDITDTLDRLKLPSWLTVIVTSLDAGANKPQPEIFRYALKQANVQPAEAMYIGDQYQVDILGARGAGMAGVLIDRYGYNENITDCPRLRSFGEIVEYL